MAISNVSSGLRPGVCTSTTRPQAPFEGQMIYETDTHRVLVWDNAAWVMIADTDTPPGLQLVASSAFTSITAASPLNMIGVFVSEFTNYRIVFNTTSATANVGISIQLMNGSSPATGSDYRFAAAGASSNGSSSNNGSATHARIETTLTAKDGTIGTSVDLYQPQKAIRTNFFGDWWYDDGGSIIYRRYGGVHNLANAYDGFRIYPDVGTMTGNVRVYGLRD